MGESSVPVFDIDELECGGVLDELEACLEEKGIFYLRGGPVGESGHEEARRLALDFFGSAPAAVREACKHPDPGLRRGYVELGGESTARVTSKGSYPDYSMSYSCGLADNVFPNGEFEQAWMSYFAKLNDLAHRIASAMARATPEAGFDHDVLRDCEPLLRLRHYPAVPEHRCAERQELRMAAHYDLSILTLIHQQPCPNGFVSLQCQMGSGFTELPAVPGSIIVICGALARLASAGRMKTPVHRVLAPPSSLRVGSNRASSVFFLRPRASYVFSVPMARTLGFDVDLAGPCATFGEWIGGNYRSLHATGTDQAREALLAANSL